MEIAVDVLGPVSEPYLDVQDAYALGMSLRPGSIDVGPRRSAIRRLAFETGEMRLCPRYGEQWIGSADLRLLTLTISDFALTAASGAASGIVELRKDPDLADARVGALVAAVNAERVAGFPSGRLFLDSVEQALAVTLIERYAVRRPSPEVFRGGLGPARLRKVTEFVDAKIDSDLRLQDMAEAVKLSVAHFSQMFRTSTGQSPHQFVLRHRIDRAKEILRTAEVGILDVALSCGFKTQQHFARVFRQVCGVSPTEYRREFLR